MVNSVLEVSKICSDCMSFGKVLIMPLHYTGLQKKGSTVTIAGMTKRKNLKDFIASANVKLTYDDIIYLEENILITKLYEFSTQKVLVY